jgi:putative nucleotidyltransferase with HDIG domain
MRRGATTSSSAATDPRTEVTLPDPAIPAPVLRLLDQLFEAGHAAYVVGGSLRDALLDRPAADWDLTTDARPNRLLDLFPDAVYENRFGTVVVRREGVAYEITTFRTDHEYADHRRPHRVEFGDRIEDDLARRDFTVNAMAWGRRPADAAPAPGPASAPAPDPALVDPFGGRADTEARLLRAVGNPHERFEEDALRMVRAVRLAATLDFTVESGTLDAISRHASLAAHLSGERIAMELEKLLAAPRPSVGLRLMADTGMLAMVSPELGAQRGIPQNKTSGEDLLDHTLRTVDAAPSSRPIVRLAALLHDIGKPATLADGHFHGHEAVGAEMAEDLLRRLRMPRAIAERVALLVRNHMFTYEGTWSDAAVRRFIMRIGRHALEELFELREADNVGSGIPADSFELTELRRRVADQLASHVALDLSDLAINGDDLIAELGLATGPAIGLILDELLDRVIADPDLNDRPTLLVLAQAMLTEEG